LRIGPGHRQRCGRGPQHQGIATSELVRHGLSPRFSVPDVGSPVNAFSAIMPGSSGMIGIIWHGRDHHIMIADHAGRRLNCSGRDPC
jgi:hypothetical protein